MKDPDTLKKEGYWYTEGYKCGYNGATFLSTYFPFTNEYVAQKRGYNSGKLDAHKDGVEQLCLPPVTLNLSPMQKSSTKLNRGLSGGS
jgi:hypothetical protein